jgi:hypothetical protein
MGGAVISTATELDDRVRSLREVIRDARRLAHGIDHVVDAVRDVGTRARLQDLSARAAAAIRAAQTVLDTETEDPASLDAHRASAADNAVTDIEGCVTDLAYLMGLDAAAALLLAHANRIARADLPAGMIAPFGILIEVGRNVRFEYEMWG